MEYLNRKPFFRVLIVRPRYTTPTYIEDVVAEFRSEQSNDALVSYNYEISLSSFEAPFSLSFTPFIINQNGDTFMDLIAPLDVVKIEEYGTLKYVGVVESTRYSARMTESGPDRMILVSGYGVGGVLDRFAMLLDQVILAESKVPLAGLETKFRGLMADLSAKHGENTSMALVLENIQKSFKEAMELIGGYPPGTGIFSLVEQYLKIREVSSGLAPTTKYPIALSLFSYGSITLGQAFRGVVVPPFYELFTRWDAAAGYWALTIRPTPYSPAAWRTLRRTVIDPIHVQSFDCGFSSAEVKTYFFAYLAGGAISLEQSRAMYQNMAVKRDSAKWGLYGYRPLEAQFRFIDQVKLDEERQVRLTAVVEGDPNAKPESISDETLMAEYSTMLQRWFGRADEMLSGSIDMMTIPDGPAAGERISFNGVEFYVESFTASWQYGGKMATTLKLTRGGQYNPNFRTGTGPKGEDVETKDNWWFRKSTGLGNRRELKKAEA